MEAIFVGIILLIVVGIITFIMENWAVILSLIVLAVIASIVYIIKERKNIDNVISARIIGSKDIFEKRTEEDGYSVGYHGDDFSYMTHYRTQDVFVGRDVTFSVVYEGGKTDIITCREGSENYTILMRKVK